MYFRELKKIALLLCMGGAINMVSAQIGMNKLKVGDDPFTYGEKSAVLEVNSTKKGFLPPRMLREKRNAIADPAEGLLVWCTDCNSSTSAIPGELCVWLGTAWTPFSFVTIPRLATGKKTDDDKPVVTAGNVTVSGTLVDVFGAVPTETGVVYREIKSNDFGTLPTLSGQGIATAPDYKVPGTLVTVAGGKISATIPALGTTRPYYFRTYAVSSSGIGYGNPVVFNLAPPAISNVVVTNGNSSSPVFAGTLNINAGTPAGIITEYGYYTGTDNPPTTKRIISDKATIADLDAKLNADSFTADLSVDLAVGDYNVTAPGITTYFRYYAIVSGQPVYSNVVSFTPSP